MKLSILQFCPVLENPESNKSTVERMTEEAVHSKPDLLLLPELWSIGFFPKRISQFAEQPNGESIQFLCNLAKKYHINIVGGSLALWDGEEIRNTCPIIDRTGNLVQLISKAHLFSPARENRYFSSGKGAAPFSLDGHTCGTAICYDLRFPELVRGLALHGTELFLLPAEWPMKRLTHFRTLLAARAIENQIFVAAANGLGHSAILNPLGEILAEAEEDESILEADIDFSVRENLKKKSDVFLDRRTDLY